MSEPVEAAPLSRERGLEIQLETVLAVADARERNLRACREARTAADAMLATFKGLARWHEDEANKYATMGPSDPGPAEHEETAMQEQAVKLHRDAAERIRRLLAGKPMA